MNLQVKNIPPDLHERLRRQAEFEKRTTNDIVLAAIEHELARHEWRERCLRYARVAPGVSAAELLEEERGARCQEPE